MAVGLAEAGPVEAEAWERFERWLERGGAAGMEYMGRHREIRRDSRLLLEGGKTIITTAFSYFQERERPEALPLVSAYAYGKDYHDVIRKRMRKALEGLEGEFRICVDSAPILERYWARKSGLGRIGRNGMVIVEGAGNQVFLAEIVTTLELDADQPAEGDCGSCGRCLRACPTGALGEEGIECGRCLSYLTIEHRGEWDETGRLAMATPAGRRTLYGCDRCVIACPHSREGRGEATLPELQGGEGMLALDAATALEMGEEGFRQRFRGSAIKRCKWEGWQRNSRNLEGEG